MVLDGDGESRLGTACMRACVCVCANNKPSRVSPLPYRPATHPQIMCVLCVHAYMFKCVCVCVRTYSCMNQLHSQTSTSPSHIKGV